MTTANERQKAYWLFGFGTLIIAGIVGANLMLTSRQSPDKTTLCIGKPAKSTVIVLDRTDGLSVQTQNEIVARVQRLVEGAVDVGELVSVFTIDEISRKELEPRFSYCKPPSTGNAAYENPRAIARQKRERFDEPLVRVLAETVGTTPDSPIAEALVDLAQSRYVNPPNGATLVVFSDMIENTSALSMYRCTSGESGVEAFKAVRAAAVQRPHLANVDVQLHVVPRSKLSPANVQCRDYFWNWFLGDRSGERQAFSAPNYLPGDVQ